MADTIIFDFRHIVLFFFGGGLRSLARVFDSHIPFY